MLTTETQHHDHDDTADIDITPLLDVVFILLIFFIVTATFVRERGLDLRKADESPSATPTIAPTIVIDIGPNNEIFVNQRVTDIRRLSASIRRWHSEHPQAVVVIAADKKARTHTLVSVMDASREANVLDISLAGIP
ncbi:MAG: biopolymer transporter ExbD [Pseudomonadota bacterium]